MTNDADESRVGDAPRGTARVPAVLTALGIAVALGGLAWSGLTHGAHAARVVFWAGWGVLTAGMLSGIVLFDDVEALARPLGVVRYGIATVAFALAFDYLGGGSSDVLWGTGMATLGGGAIWAVRLQMGRM